MATFHLGFGKGTLPVTLPDEKILAVIEGRPVQPVGDVRAAVQAALRRPIGAPPLAEVIKPGDKVAIVASDVTRAWLKQDQFLPVLLDELNGAGIPDDDIFLVVALGAHRRHSEAEHVATYGQEVVSRIRILQSYALDEDDFVYVGVTSRGVRACLNRHVVGADKVILTGGIVYHSMAGFGGGRKSIVPGIASYQTIQANHNFCLHPEIGKGTNPHCDSGKLAGNPMHEDLMEIAAMLNPAFLLNAIMTADGQFAGFVAGHWRAAWEEGCRTVEAIFGVPVTGKADLVIASAGGYPKDINLYQGTKAQDNAMLACKDGGVVILVLACPDIAEPPDFSGWFDYQSLYDRELALRQAFTVPGFVALKCGEYVRRTPNIVVTLPENRDFIAKTGMIPAASLEEALAIAEAKLGRKDYTITVMPHGANTVPLIKTQ
ncbi:conserved hypothetical protein [Thermosinus carboxydivorans Nor1]|uniref:Uncharacterized protein n=1 Tax=Thermosinus carboxydivorans Nor1 TaxID=401526 RepID=A1HLY5_9FIRM|nr:nickel-dependent lactate racemase [Thermosinus carboxydivorans]EAX48837.1 conserved hypothetical protein [Thermosinus carboxydivorans Nor1]